MADELDVQDAPKKKKKGLLIWIILLLVLGGLGAGGYFYVYPKFFAKPKPSAEGAEQAPAEGGHAPAKAEEKAAGGHGGGEKGGEKGEKGKEGAGKPKPVALAPFVVNLSDPLGRRYLKLTIMVETMGAAANAELTDKEPQVRDQIIMLLSSKTYQELATMESKMALKADIVRRLNQILGGSKVLQVYFTEMVIQ
jgi:flagellar FliL protein